jgi:hypothetical protein
MVKILVFSYRGVLWDGSKATRNAKRFKAEARSKVLAGFFWLDFGIIFISLRNTTELDFSEL